MARRGTHCTAGQREKANGETQTSEQPSTRRRHCGLCPSNLNPLRRDAPFKVVCAYERSLHSVPYGPSPPRKIGYEYPIVKGWANRFCYYREYAGAKNPNNERTSRMEACSWARQTDRRRGNRVCTRPGYERRSDERRESSNGPIMSPQSFYGGGGRPFNKGGMK